VVQGIAGDWQFNGIGSFLSGLPFTVTMQTNALNTGGGTQFPNRLRSGELPEGERSILRWFDATAFAAPGQYIFGNSGRNIVTPSTGVRNTSTAPRPTGSGPHPPRAACRARLRARRSTSAGEGVNLLRGSLEGGLHLPSLDPQ
jgi:hypothetical protein